MAIDSRSATARGQAPTVLPAEPPVDAAAFAKTVLQIVVDGIPEALVGLIFATTLTAFQVVVWAIARWHAAGLTSARERRRLVEAPVAHLHECGHRAMLQS